MIYVKFYSKTKGYFFENINRKLSAEIEKIINNPGVDIIYQSPYTKRNEMIFQYRNYKNGKENIEWISVDKLYLDRIIKEQ